MRFHATIKLSREEIDIALSKYLIGLGYIVPEYPTTILIEMNTFKELTATLIQERDI